MKNVYFDRVHQFTLPIIGLFLFYVCLNPGIDRDAFLGLFFTVVFNSFLFFLRPFQSFLVIENNCFYIFNSIFKNEAVLRFNQISKYYINYNAREVFFIMKTFSEKSFRLYVRESVCNKIIIDIAKFSSNLYSDSDSCSELSYLRYNKFRIKVLFINLLGLVFCFLNLSIFYLGIIILLQVWEFYESTGFIFVSKDNEITLATFDLPESITFKKNELESLDFLKIGGFIFPRCCFSLKDGSVIRFKVDNYKKLIELINSNSETLVHINFKWFNWFKFSNVKSRII